MLGLKGRRGGEGRKKRVSRSVLQSGFAVVICFALLPIFILFFF